MLYSRSCCLIYFIYSSMYLLILNSQFIPLPFFFKLRCNWGFPGGSNGKECACNAEDPGLISGSGRSPGGGHGNPRQYSCPENSMDRGDYSPWGHKESDTTERLTLSLTHNLILVSGGQHGFVEHNISIHCKMIITISLVNIHHYTL